MKSIRTLLFLVLAGMIMCSCGASYQEAKERRAAEKEAERAAFAAALQNCDFTLEITRLIPRGYPSRESVGEYRLRLEKDVVTTRLPFLGESREAAYGGDEISIVFNKEKVNLIKDFADADKGEYRYQFRGGEGNGKWTVSIQVYDNGSALIGCQGTGSRYMSYYANLILPQKDAENK